MSERHAILRAMSLRTALALLAGLWLGAASAQLQSPVTVAPPLPPQFEIEIIVFANREFDPAEERFEAKPRGLPAEPLAPFVQVPVFDPTALQEPATDVAPPAPAPLDLPPDPLEEARAAAEQALRIRPLAPSALKLGAEYRRLQALSAYEPLLHAGWVQPGLPEDEAQPFDLGVLGVVNPSGTVRVHLSRFLHITLDLTFQGSSLEGVPVANDGLGEVTLAPRYRLKATRSARSGELHYFDHPAFGVLVRVTPVPAPGESPGADARPAA
jgi:hypothetical protein